MLLSDIVSQMMMRTACAFLRVRERVQKPSGPPHTTTSDHMFHKPDLVFPSRRITVFVHGCFWHRHPGCRQAKLLQMRADFRRRKLEANVERDVAALAALEAAGWTALVMWECEVGPEALERLYERIKEIPVTR